MRSHVRLGSLIMSLVVGGILSGCFSSTKEVETVPAPAPVVQAPPVVQLPPPVVVTGRGCESDHYLDQLE